MRMREVEKAPGTLARAAALEGSSDPRPFEAVQDRRPRFASPSAWASG